MKLKRIAPTSQPVQPTVSAIPEKKPAAKTAPAVQPKKPAIEITQVTGTVAQEVAPAVKSEKWNLGLPPKENSAAKTSATRKPHQIKTPASNSNNQAKDVVPVSDQKAQRKLALDQLAKFGKECQGKKEYTKFLQGEPINRNAAIKAKCYDCCGYFEDGRVDCQNHTCPLYSYFPYSSDKSQAVRKNTGNKNPTWLRKKPAENAENPEALSNAVAQAMTDEDGVAENEEDGDEDNDGEDEDAVVENL